MKMNENNIDVILGKLLDEESTKLSEITKTDVKISWQKLNIDGVITPLALNMLPCIQIYCKDATNLEGGYSFIFSLETVGVLLQSYLEIIPETFELDELCTNLLIELFTRVNTDMQRSISQILKKDYHFTVIKIFQFESETDLKDGVKASATAHVVECKLGIRDEKFDCLFVADQAILENCIELNQKSDVIENATTMKAQKVAFPTFAKQDVSHQALVNKNMELLMNIPLSVTVEIGSAKRKIKDILKLGAGSVIELEKQAGDPVDILVNGQMIARGDVVVIDDSFGVRINEILGVADLLTTLESEK